MSSSSQSLIDLSPIKSLSLISIALAVLSSFCTPPNSNAISSPHITRDTSYNKAIFKTLENIGASYKAVGAYFREIIEKVKIGTSLEQAVNEAVELVPSDPLRKILWQVANSLRTGSNVSRPLENVVETIIREQKIETNEYGRKLNPLAMFYMMMAIIVPSLGTTMLTIISIFAGLRISMPFLIAIVVVNGFIQFMFVAIISSSRPAVEL